MTNSNIRYLSTMILTLIVLMALLPLIEFKPMLVAVGKQAETDDPSAYVEGEAIVGFYGPMAISQGVYTTTATKYGITLSDTSTELSAALYTNVNDYTFSKLQTDSDVKYVHRNYLASASITPNDPYWSYQWGPVSIQAPQAWDITTGSSSFMIAVADTGIDYNHPDLSANYQGGYDWVNSDNDPWDDSTDGHGTHVTGIIAASGNNGIGIAGMVWQISIIAEKVLDSTGSGTWWWVSRGIVDAADRGAKIINLSLGGSGFMSIPEQNSLRQSVQYAYDRGCLLVAAAGNDGPMSDSIEYPARFPEVIAVGAVDNNNALASFSSRGPEQELVAPGVDIYSTLPTRLGSYGYMDGTSMACPHVVGVAALAWITNPNLSRDELRYRLNNTALDLGSAGWDQLYGYGKVMAYQSVINSQFQYSVSVSPTSQTITPGGSVTYTVSASLIQAPTQTVSLGIDPMYPLNPDLTASLVPSSGTPSFTTTLTLTASTSARFFTEVLRIQGTFNAAGSQIIRFSNFFTISITVAPGDFVWIKTNPSDNGNVPRRPSPASPDIWSVPEKPVRGQTNTLYIRVRNRGASNTGQVLVEARYGRYNPLPFISNLPSVGPASIDNIAPGGDATVSFPWYVPSDFPEHFCVFAQAWRPTLEPHSDQFDLKNNNNVAQRNFDAVTASSPYKTTLIIDNPTNHTLSITMYLKPTNQHWITDVCRPSTWNGTHLITPLMIPPREHIDIDLTIFRPTEAPLGQVDISANITDYEYIYPDLSGFTFEISKKPSVGGVVILADKFDLLTPYIGLASTILIATVAAAICVKRVKHKKVKQ